MRIPHVVSNVILGAYVPTQEELETMEESEKASSTFPAANFTWDARIIPSLKFLVLQRLAELFYLMQPLVDKEDSGITQEDTNTLVEILPVNTDLKLTVPTINYEVYWEKCCKVTWPKCNIIPKEYNQFWKTIFLKKYLEEYFETANPKIFDEEASVELAELIQDYITSLNIQQLQVTECPPMPNCRDGTIRDECIRPDLDIPLNHIPLEKALSRLINLTEFRIVFSVKNLVGHFDWRAFRFSISDCESICAGLKVLPFIRVLCINRTVMDSERAKVFIRFVAEKESIEEIDFSHCQVGDEALIALGGLIMEHTNLKVIKMRNNTFDEAGLQGFGNALQKDFKAPLVTLDMGMNFMTDVGANYLAAGLVRCKEKPTEVLISSCCFNGLSAMAISRMVKYNTCILELDISANNFSEEAETLMMEAVEYNRHILKMDLRQIKISDENVEKIREFLSRNKEIRDKNIEIVDEELPPLYMEDPEYLIWEYNPTNPEHRPGQYPPRQYVDN